MKRVLNLVAALCLTAAVTAPALAQSEAENNAYRIFYNEKDAAKKIELGEKYLTDFKESTYRGPILQTILNAYVQGQNWSKVIEHGEKLMATLPAADAKTKATLYTLAMVAAQSSNNAGKTIDFGEKVLTADPNNLNAQLLVATTIPQSSPQDKAANDKAMELANKALAGVADYFKQPKPANMTDAQWKQARAEYDDQLHSALGSIYFNRAEYPKSEEQYQIVAKSNPKDPVAHYYLGSIYLTQTGEASRSYATAFKAEDEAKRARADQPTIDELSAKRQGLEGEIREKTDKAIDEFATAVAIGGPVGTQAKTQLEALYKRKNDDSLAGMDDLIAKKKTALQ